jgi:pimeloyl-ACP methyl ester carboxylesterase
MMIRHALRTPNERHVAVGAVSLMVYDWPGEGPPILFAHANGFHARCWDQVIAYLPGRRCLAVDLRGHGRSDKPAPPYPWRAFAEDLVRLGEALSLQGAIGVGHSVGGYATALAAALTPGMFAALLLVDPVILAREAYGVPFTGGEFAARRRNTWESPEAMIERFRHRAPFNHWRPEVLNDYCQHGLLPGPEGAGYVLACPPAIEAAIYAGATEVPIYEELARIEVPTVVLRGHPYTHGAQDLAGSPTAPDLATYLPHGRDVPLVNHSHFIPMEAPSLVANAILDLI